MYCDFYQLRERPFNVTSDPKFLYLNTCYREALASLNYGISQRKGFITLIGEAGTGKTTLLKKLMDDLDEQTRTVFIFNTNVTFDEILEYVFNEFDLPVHNGKRLYMLQRLNKFLLEELGNGRNVALLIDEAQDLEFSVMEDLRLLSNLETAKEKILQIVLAGQPELGQKLGNPGLRQLRQRVAINCRLQPLSPDEVSEYIQARLVAAGSTDPKLFSRDAEARIYEISRGIPRLVNVVCDNALVIGYALGKRRIGGDVVKEAAADLFSVETPEGVVVRTPELEGESPAPRPVRTSRWGMPQIGMVAVAVAAILIGMLSLGRTLFGHETGRADAPVVAHRPLDVVGPAADREPRAPAAPVVQAHRPVVGVAPIARAHPPSAAGVPVREVVSEDPVPVVATDERAGSAAVTGAAEAVPEVARSGALAQVLDGAPEQERGVAGRGAAVHRQVEVERAGDAAVVPDAVVPARVREPKPTDAVRVEVPVAAPAAGIPVASVPDRAAANDPGGNTEAVATLGSEAVLPRPEIPVPAPATEKSGPGTASVRPLSIGQERTVIARPGDSVSVIAIRHYGLVNYTILDLLKIANPAIHNIDVIGAGQKLRLPALAEGLAVLRQHNRKYALLLMSSPRQRRVNALEVELRRRGFQAQVRRTDFGAGRTVYRLLVPNFSERSAALAAGRKLRRLFREDRRIAELAREG